MTITLLSFVPLSRVETAKPTAALHINSKPVRNATFWQYPCLSWNMREWKPYSTPGTPFACFCSMKFNCVFKLAEFAELHSFHSLRYVLSTARTVGTVDDKSTRRAKPEYRLVTSPAFSPPSSGRSTSRSNLHKKFSIRRAGSLPQAGPSRPIV
jgi:hypothetical protein